MKRLLFILPLCLLIALTGCTSRPESTAQDASWLTDAKPIYVSEWPDNAFTAALPRPKSGEIDYIYDFSDAGRYGIWYKDITIEQGKAYLQALKDNGWTSVAAEDGGVSVGTLFQKGDMSLSVALSEGVLGLLITQNAAQ